MKSYRSKRSQAGEGELAIFGVAVLVCALISAAIFTLNWFKDTKDGRLEARRQAAINKHNPKQQFVATPDPDAYYVSCKKSLWQALNKNISCKVTQYSYGELDFLTYEYE